MDFKTKQIHSGATHDKQFGAHATPIYQTSTFIFEDCKEGGDRFAGRDSGYKYTRLGNPNSDEVAKRIAALENTDMGLVTSTGMSAISTIFFALLKSGEHFIASDCLYGGTVGLINNVINNYNMLGTYVDVNDEDALRSAFKENTKMIYIETPANPTMNLIDIKKVAKIAKEKGVALVVDNTFMTPYLQNPIDLGADVVVHSATKYINGHGDVVAGIIAGKKEIMTKIKSPFLLTIGGTGSPFDSWLIMRGLKTLSIRMDHHCKNAMEVAKFLENHPKIDKVYYPGLESFPQYELAKEQMKDFGGMIAFELKGGFEAGETLLNNLKMIALAVSLGSVDSLIQHPASMTHAGVPKHEREIAGITDGLVRLSVGIEGIEDIIKDLEDALKLV